jgi:hypothetical protein
MVGRVIEGTVLEEDYFLSNFFMSFLILRKGQKMGKIFFKKNLGPQKASCALQRIFSEIEFKLVVTMNTHQHTSLDGW